MTKEFIIICHPDDDEADCVLSNPKSVKNALNKTRAQLKELKDREKELKNEEEHLERIRGILESYEFLFDMSLSTDEAVKIFKSAREYVEDKK